MKKILCTALSAILIITVCAACGRTPAAPEIAADVNIYTESTIENPPEGIIGANFSGDMLYVFGVNSTLSEERLASYYFVLNTYTAEGDFIAEKSVAKLENVKPRGAVHEGFSYMYLEAFPAPDGFLLLREDVTPLGGYGNFDVAYALVPLSFDGVLGAETDFTERFMEIEGQGISLESISVENGEISVNEENNTVWNISPDRRIELTKTFSIEYAGSVKSITIYTKIPPEVLAQRTVVKLGGMIHRDNFEGIVRAFNAQSAEYVVEFVEYGDESESAVTETDSFSAVLTSAVAESDSFYAALMKGDIPDLVISGGNDRFLTDKGLIADLNILMESDPEFDRADYFENIFEANERGGKLYSVSPYIMPSALAAKSDLSILESNRFISVGSVIAENYDTFVDEENGVCYFDTPEFIQFLEYSKQFYVDPKIQRANEGDLETRVTAENKRKSDFRHGTGFTEDIYFNISSYLESKYVLFSGETPVIVKYPGGSSGISTSFGNFLIFEDAPNKAGAWEFVKYMLSEKYQDTIGGFYTPIRRSSFDKSSAAYIEKSAPYEVDLGGEIITVPKATEGDIAEIRGFIESIDSINRLSFYLELIVEEETSAFYAGDKTAAETAKLIQNRMTVFVNE